MRVTAMRGYAGSGKSTAAREMASQTGAVIVSRDAIRKRLFGRYTNVDEDAVTTVETAEVTALLDAGKSVIIDACHLQHKYLKKWATLASQYGADWDIYDILTEPIDCILQDADIDRVREGKHVGHGVIHKQAKRWPQSRWQVVEAPDAFTIVPYVLPQGQPFAIICDIDGTAAHLSETKPRSHYDYTRVSEDQPDYCIRDLLWKYAGTDVVILFVSGREDTCRGDTEAWLQTHDFPYNAVSNHLYMRPANDYRNDTIIKYEIFDESIRDDYRVLFALDDRDRIVNMWRELGLKCLQVEPGNF